MLLLKIFGVDVTPSEPQWSHLNNWRKIRQIRRIANPA